MVDYIVCPVCGRNRVVESKKKGLVGWPNGTPLDLETTNLLQVRGGGGKKPEGGGRGYRGSAPGAGFPLIEGESKTLTEMIKNGDYPEVLEGMKTQIINVVKQSIIIGFIKREELEV